VATKVNHSLNDGESAALRRELQQLKRTAASQKLDLIRAGTRPISTSKLVALIRRDRGRLR
jgi:hypothetical protein